MIPATHSLPLIPVLYDQTVAGLKTETRRVVVLKGGSYWCADTERWVRVEPSEYTEVGQTDDGRWGFGVNGYLIETLSSPYGGPGDLLHVGEALVPQRSYGVEYATYVRGGDTVDQPVGVPWRWKVRKLSGRFCPKAYRRLWLTVRSVHIERVQDITETGAKAEGAKPQTEYVDSGECIGGGIKGRTFKPTYNYVAGFRGLWDSINHPRGYGWTVNPFTWVVRYSIASTTGDPRDG